MKPSEVYGSCLEYPHKEIMSVAYIRADTRNRCTQKHDSSTALKRECRLVSEELEIDGERQN